MKKYTVYFEVFGHKLKHTIHANNQEQAKDLIKEKIYFHKVVEKPNKEDQTFENIKDVFRNAGINL